MSVTVALVKGAELAVTVSVVQLLLPCDVNVKLAVVAAPVAGRGKLVGLSVPLLDVAKATE